MPHLAASDGYIDDQSTVTLDDPLIIRRAEAAATLAAFLIWRSVSPNEPIPHPHPLSRDKLTSEGGLVELQNLLGWDISTRLHTVALPQHKQAAYTACIIALLAAQHIDAVELEKLLGKLNHASYIIPLARHFTARLRVALDRARICPTTFTAEEAHDMELWIFFLQRAADSISINLIVFRSPDLTVWSDSCPRGLRR